MGRDAPCPSRVVGNRLCEDRIGVRCAHRGMGCHRSGWPCRDKEAEGGGCDCSLAVAERPVDMDPDSDRMDGTVCLAGSCF